MPSTSTTQLTEQLDFNDKGAIKRWLESLDAATLLLQQGLTHASYASEQGHTVTLLSVEDSPEKCTLKAGVFYNGIIAGCSCADDPTPANETTEYCELEISVIKPVHTVRISLIS